MRKPRNRNRKTEDQPETAAPLPGKLSTIFELPPGALSDTPQIELSGNREAVVENCRGVLEYDENIIRLATDKMSIRFLGRNLQIKVLTHDSAIVTGFITGIEFLT